jgi:diguanylate cyclase (GGDEF)-like protein
VTSRAPNIVIIEITDKDIYELGQWPWPRARIAQLCLILHELGSKQIYLDFLFAAHSKPEGDEALARALKEAGNVYLPFIFTTQDLSIDKAVFPIPKLSQAAKGTGAAILFPDMDGKWRRIPLFFNLNGKMYKHIVLQMAEDGLGMEVKNILAQELLLGNDKESISIPLVQGNKMVLNWQGRWAESFRRVSFSDLLRAYQDMKGKKSSPVDIFSLKGSICLVAVTASGLHDKKINPLDSSYPGVGVVATALSNIYSGSFLRIVPYWLFLLIVYLFAIIPPFYISSDRYGREFFFLLALGGAFLGAVVLFYNGWIMNFSLPFIVLAGSYFVVTFYNSACLAREKKKLLALATTDGLTGLFNIRYFKEVLNDECFQAQKDSKRQFSVIICDIDHFKEFNDRYGHQVGDFAIEGMARILKNTVRSEDVVARYGGDEVIVLLRQATLENACLVAEKIRSAVENLKFNCPEGPQTITVSLGVACFGLNLDSPVRLIKKADDALYIAKQKGRNQVCYGE